MATKQPPAKPLRGFTLCCPLCQADEANISIQLGHLGEGEETFFCTDCDTGFCREDVISMFDRIRRWTAVLTWLDTVPQFGE